MQETFLKGELKKLTFREREIIKLRFGIGDGYTYTCKEVGRIFKLTPERIRQIEKKGVVKLGPSMRRWNRFVNLADR